MVLEIVILERFSMHTAVCIVQCWFSSDKDI